MHAHTVYIEVLFELLIAWIKTIGYIKASKIATKIKKSIFSSSIILNLKMFLTVPDL